jgi:uncharacterized protein YyaL (SSP411 family)
VRWLILLLLAASAEAVEWQKWDQALLERAAHENRFILIDLQAVWCHWCHVMEETTYRDARVNQLLADRYLPVRVDQDGDPELSSRYEDYGWPATIVLAPDGSELVKRRGYIDPERMASLLEAIIADPTPGPSVTGESETVSKLDARTLAAAKKRFFASYDRKWGGWGEMHKFVQADALEYVALLAKKDARARRMLKQTLDAALQLIDPVWGGMYQYSDSIDWKSPHFEKIISIQADAIRVYSDAYRQLHDARYLNAARNIDRYIGAFLTSPDGAIYTSQDADLNETIDGHHYYPLSDEKRRALGIPNIDKHVYARECGWMIAAWASLYSATHDEAILKKAVKAAEWALRERALPGGGFVHQKDDRSLADNLAMAQGLAALSQIDSRFRKEAQATFAYIGRTFRDPRGGFFNAPTRVFSGPSRSVEENAALARAAGLFGERELADHARKILDAERPWVAPILLATAN